tara:strand:- start:1703 stop:2737 length:1035 start_codon:yes stop_codon:yes gene_type:complete
MYDKTIIFWVEASQMVATGHFMESLALAKAFKNKSINVHFIINRYEPVEAKLFSANITFSIFKIDDVDKVISFINDHFKDTVIIINHRNIQLYCMEKLKSENHLLVVIDQLGNKKIICDILINSSIISDWLKYDFIENFPTCLFGPDFTILRDEFLKLNKIEKSFENDFPIVLVTMGGVDRTGATLRIVRALKSLNISSNKKIVIGKGFAHTNELKVLLNSEGFKTFQLYQNINDLGEKMSKADVVISAGGNTVSELACVGTPGLILWEDLHEKIQGEEFEKEGIVINLGNGLKTDLRKIISNIESLLLDIKKRKSMSNAGKKLIDGRGVERIINKIKENQIFN